MSVDYNKFAKTFSNSRKNMKWKEIDYFLNNYLKNKKEISILDVGCWNGRFLNHLKQFLIANWNLEEFNYLWVDLSEWLLEEAKKNHSENDFLKLDMLDLDRLKNKFDYIFFIASFHHLDSIEKRLEVLKKAKNLLKQNWKIFIINWALNSKLNKEKYLDSIIKDSENQFWWLDYLIKIGKFNRYYHCFSLKELEFLFKQAWIKIIENKIFDNNRNFISILEK